MIGVAVAVTIVFLVIVMQMASAPSYATLLTGLDPAQTGKITSTLDTKGISYQLQNNGTALAVESGKTGDARVVRGDDFGHGSMVSFGRPRGAGGIRRRF